jgi:primosomal protein N' (replication factor Y)
VSLTYHEHPPRLLCHHCGAQEAAPPTCPRCGSAYLRRFGAGTERAEAELARILPNARVIRMDADTTTRKGSHEAALSTFERLDSAVLLGTQMIAKGLDYPEVTLVGVLNADTSMHIPDFRAAERTYQLLEQVAGRAGRGPKGGRVIIQTYWPEHPAVQALASGSAEALYAREREERRALGFPPYGRIANVVFTGATESDVEAAARAAALALEGTLDPPAGVLGPSPAPIARLKGQWRWHLLAKGPEDADLPAALDAALTGLRLPPEVTMVVDVDPLSLL